MFYGEIASQRERKIIAKLCVFLCKVIRAATVVFASENEIESESENESESD